MTLVVPGAAEALDRVRKIRGHVEDIKVLIVEAYRARDWDALGYSSWDEYCQGEFGGGIAIPKSERGDLVFTLRDAGLSYRAIEAVTDMNASTAMRITEGLVSPSVANATVEESPPVVGVNGKKYAPRRPERVTPEVITPARQPEQATPEPTSGGDSPESSESPESPVTEEHQRFVDAVRTIGSTPDVHKLYEQGGVLLSRDELNAAIDRLMVYIPMQLTIRTTGG